MTVLRLPVLLGLLMALGSCGYRVGLQLPEGQRRIGVELFANDSLQPDLERGLHEALTRSLRDRTEAELVRPSRASLVVRGRVLDYSRRGGIRSPQNRWLESAVTISAEAQLIQVSDGKQLAQARGGTQVGFSFGVEGGEVGAAQRALDNLADQLILELFIRAERSRRGQKANRGLDDEPLLERAGY